MDDSTSTIERVASKAFDWALYGVLFVAPLFMGGRGPFGKFVSVCFVSLMTLAWVVQSLCRKTVVLRLSGAEWIIAAGTLLLVFQLIPYPETVLLTLSPNLRELLPIWFSSPDSDHFQIGTWNTISLSPHATRQALAVYVAYALFFMLLVQRIRKLDDVEWLLRSLAYGTIGLAVLGLAQFLTSNGKFLWFYEHPFRTTDRVVKGPFQNQNHFAHMMALGIGPLLWMLSTAFRGQTKPTKTNQSKRHRRNNFSGKKQRPPVSLEVLVITFGIGLVALAAMLTFSRGGFLAFAAATLIVVGLYHWQNLGEGATLKIAGGAGVMVIVTLCIYGYEPLAQRLSTLHESQSLEELSHGRRALWDAMLSATQNFWLTGTGIGSHPDVYPVYMSEFYNVEFTHGESGYLSLLMEGGVGAFALLLSAIIYLFYCLSHFAWNTVRSDSRESIRLKLLIAPLVATLSASLLHSVGDFVWYISGCMSWTIVTIAITTCLCGVTRVHVAKQEIWRTKSFAILFPKSICSIMAKVHCNMQLRLGANAKVVVVGFVGVALMPAVVLYSSARAALPWDDYRRLSRQVTSSNDSSMQNHLAALLEQALAHEPAHRRAGLMLAQHVWQMQNKVDRQPGKTVSSAEKTPMHTLVASHAIDVLSQYPLQGRAYAIAMPTHLNASQSRSDMLLTQAFLVRPHDALLHMLQGKRLLGMGESDRGFRHWSFAFNHDREVRESLIAQLCPILPSQFLVEKLKPGKEGLWQLFHNYRSQARHDSIVPVAKELIELLESEISGSKDRTALVTSSYGLYVLHEHIQDSEKALRYIQLAADVQPQSYQYRKTLAIVLCRQEQFVLAVKHLKWCHSRRPSDLHVERLLRVCVRHEVSEANGVDF